MFNKITDIKTAISSFRKDTVWMRLRQRWDSDFALYYLQPYNAGSGYYSYTTNASRVYADKMISLITGSKLIIRIPLDVLKDEERRQASNTERFLYGALTLNDERLALLGMSPLQDQLAWYANIRGGVCVRIHTHKNDKGETVPQADAWDIYNTSYALGKNGLAWAAQTRKATKAQIKDEYGIDIGTDYGDIIDYYDTKNYAIIVGSRWAVEPTPHGFDYCPVFLIRAGAMPPVWQETYQNTGIHIGESIFASNRDIYPLLSKTISDHLTIVRRGVKPPMGYWSAMGDKTLDEDIYQVEKAGTISLAFNEEIKPIITPTMPMDTAPLLVAISGEIQRGSLPHTVYGELGFRLSGFAINQLQGSIETVLMPFMGAVGRAYQAVCLSLLNQFATGRFPPLYVRGRTARGETFGIPEAYKIKASELKGDWHPEIRLEPTLPKDEAQRYIMANMAREGEIPLLSYQTIRDELLGVEDTDLEERKINREWAAALIIPRLYDAYLSALEDGKADVAENIRGELMRLLGQIGQPAKGGARGQGAGTTRQEAVAAEMPGVGIPPGETGVPSNVLPSEALGGVPGGAMAAQGRLF